MKNEFVFEQVANLIGTSVFFYDSKLGIRKAHGKNNTWEGLNKKQGESLRSMFKPDKGADTAEYPVVCALEDQMFAVKIYAGGESWLIVGPILPEMTDNDTVVRVQNKYNSLKDLGITVLPFNLNKFISGVLVLFWCMSGQALSYAKFWEYNNEYFDKVRQIPQRLSHDIFIRQETALPHNPYDQEQRELESIRRGDLDALEKSVSETYPGEIGILASEPLRHHKNVAIGNITLASREAVRGGVSAEQAFSMADSLICQVEELESISEVEMFKREAQRVYAAAVHEELSSGIERKNPLIAAAKDYIFSHLHSMIQVSDIAESLGVNADYLSHLFRVQEHMPLKQYIFLEKIRRSQNLLRYSDCGIKDIAFYLGFSSQSHFARVFRKLVGMNPGEYRKQFGKRDTWKII